MNIPSFQTTRSGVGDAVDVEASGRFSRTASRLNWRALAGWLPHFAAIALAVSVGVILAVTPVGSGDYGQWLMASRFYQGLEVPGYRNLSAVPPLMPASLAGLRMLISDPILSLQVYKALLGAVFVLAYYLAGAAVFRQRVAGLLTAIFAFLVSDRLLELFAFGGMPQIMALTFLALSVAAFAQGKGAPRLERRWWVLGTVCLALAMLSHVGTGMIAVISGGSVAVLSALGNPNLGMRQRIEALTPLGTGMALLGVYYVLVLIPANQAYASNPASLNYRGPGMIWDLLTAHRPALLALWIGGAFILCGVLFDAIGKRRIGGFALVAAWAAGTWGFLGLSMLQQSATDYPRFVAPLVAPLMVAAGGGLALTAGAMVSGLRDPWHGAAYNGVALAAAGVLALGIGPTTMRRHVVEEEGYHLDDRTALLKATAFIDANLPKDQGVLAPTREGKWIEGLTGRAALFPMPVRFSFRPIERQRDIAAETLVQSTASMTNEYFFIQYAEGKAAGSYLVPQQPWIAINHRGEFVDVARITSATSRVFAEDGEKLLATMANLKAVRVDAHSEDSRVSLRTVWAGSRSGKPVSYSRTMTLARGSTDMDLVDEVETPLGVGGLEIAIAPVGNNAPEEVRVGTDGADLYYHIQGKTRPHLRITALDGATVSQTDDGTIVVRANGSKRLHVQLSSPTPAKPIADLRLIDPYQELRDLKLGAVLLKNDAAAAGRLDRLVTLGFTRQQDFGTYLVVLRDKAAPAQGNGAGAA